MPACGLRALDGRLHEGREGLSTSGKTCILADDGLTTGATMTVAVNWARGNGAAAVVVAVPVGSPEAVAWLRRIADRVVCLRVPRVIERCGGLVQGLRPGLQSTRAGALGCIDAARA